MSDAADIMMIESSIRELNRLELIHTYIAKLTMYIDKTNFAVLPDNVKHYTAPNDFKS